MSANRMNGHMREDAVTRFCAEENKNGAQESSCTLSDIITGSNFSCSQKKTKATKKDAPTNLKTPASLLHDICQQKRATIAFPVEEQQQCSQQGRTLFKSVIKVTTIHGKIYEGIGYASCKKSAKHNAAKDLLFQLDPKCELLLSPEFQQNANYNGNQSALLADAPVENVSETAPCIQNKLAESDVNNAETTSMTADSVKEGMEGTLLVTAKQEDQIKITLTLPYLNIRKLSVTDMVPIVRDWRGEKITRLKRMSTAQVDEIKNPIRVVDLISTEQNLNAEYFILEEKSEDDVTLKYTCILEITSLPLEGDGKQQSYLHFTEFGNGNDPSGAQRIAAQRFLLMIRMILSAN